MDVAEPTRAQAAIWSKLLPFVLLVWALTGAFYPAVDLCAGEKERGTLETLNRDELQGVVAHEFSHILNGDMRLNIRMLGVLAGIVFLGSIGEFVIRSVRGTKEKEALALFLIGVALFIIGYIGLFFARLIKAAVSRQREYLADASSVQFTRNPDAIAGALDQIRSEVADLTLEATARVTGKVLDAEDQRRLIDEAIAELDFSALEKERS